MGSFRFLFLVFCTDQHVGCRAVQFYFQPVIMVPTVKIVTRAVVTVWTHVTTSMDLVLSLVARLVGREKRVNKVTTTRHVLLFYLLKTHKIKRC